MAIERAEPRPGGGTLRGPIRSLAAGALAIIEVLLCLSMFGPQELGWLWVGSQVDFATDSLSAGLAVAFVGSVATIVATVWLARRIEFVWQGLRAPRTGPGGSSLSLFETAVVISTILALIGFVIWFFVIAGPGPTIAPEVH